MSRNLFEFLSKFLGPKFGYLWLISTSASYYEVHKVEQKRKRIQRLQKRVNETLSREVIQSEKPRIPWEILYEGRPVCDTA